MSSRWKLKCRIRQGMFEGEYLAIIDVINEKGQRVEAAAFIDEREIALSRPLEKGGIGEGFVDVSIMGAAGENASVVLPQPTLANGPIVVVDKSNLEPVGGVIRS